MPKDFQRRDPGSLTVFAAGLINRSVSLGALLDQLGCFSSASQWAMAGVLDLVWAEFVRYYGMEYIMVM